MRESSSGWVWSRGSQAMPQLRLLFAFVSSPRVRPVSLVKLSARRWRELISVEFRMDGMTW
jgi:hypothetical protein